MEPLFIFAGMILAPWAIFPHRPSVRWWVMVPTGWLVLVVLVAAVYGYFYGFEYLYSGRIVRGIGGATKSAMIWSLIVGLPGAAVALMVAGLKMVPATRRVSRTVAAWALTADIICGLVWLYYNH